MSARNEVYRQPQSAYQLVPTADILGVGTGHKEGPRVRVGVIGRHLQRC